VEKANLAQLESFITAELAGPAWSAARHQSLAEATLEPGGETAEHYHPRAEELLCCCAPANSDDDTVLTGG
jgi:quercetin dioxygenase-like cupin family protein